MTKQEWIDARAAYIVNVERMSERTAPIMAKRIADAFERKNADVSTWPEPTFFSRHPFADVGDEEAT